VSTLRDSLQNLHSLACSFADRDMVMRYYYGLGVGHTYAHEEASKSASTYQPMAEGLERIEEDDEEINVLDDIAQGSGDFSDSSIPSDGEGWQDEDDDFADSSDDEESYQMEMMYGPI
jgi:hypothetical protein